METIKHLSEIQLFEGLPEEHLENLSSIARKRNFDPGEMIFLENGESKGFYVIMEGRVKIYKISSDGKEQILNFFTSGDPFGEVSVFTGERFPANAEAVEKSKILFFPRDSFVNLIKKNPSLALNMLGILSRRLHRFTRLIEDLSLKEVPGRLAAYILYLSKNKPELHLDVSKGQLASLLGTIPETLSRVFRRMTEQGLIRMYNQRFIEILDKNSLQELAAGDRKL
jgi:CRP-like cAMP-binding protein